MFLFKCLFSLQNSLAFTPAVAFSFCFVKFIKENRQPYTTQKCIVCLGKKRKVMVILCRAESSGVCWFSLFLYSRKHEIFCFSFSFRKFSGTWKALHWEFVWETFTRVLFFFVFVFCIEVGMGEAHVIISRQNQQCIASKAQRVWTCTKTTFLDT